MIITSPINEEMVEAIIEHLGHWIKWKDLANIHQTSLLQVTSEMLLIETQLFYGSVNKWSIGQYHCSLLIYQDPYDIDFDQYTFSWFYLFCRVGGWEPGRPSDLKSDGLLLRHGVTCQTYLTPWRNGSASDSRSEGCVFESRRGHKTFLLSSTIKVVEGGRPH